MVEHPARTYFRRRHRELKGRKVLNVTDMEAGAKGTHIISASKMGEFKHKSPKNRLVSNNKERLEQAKKWLKEKKKAKSAASAKKAASPKKKATKRVASAPVKRKSSSKKATSASKRKYSPKKSSSRK